MWINWVRKTVDTYISFNTILCTIYSMLSVTQELQGIVKKRDLKTLWSIKTFTKIVVFGCDRLLKNNNFTLWVKQKTISLTIIFTFIYFFANTFTSRRVFRLHKCYFEGGSNSQFYIIFIINSTCGKRDITGDSHSPTYLNYLQSNIVKPYYD